MRRITFAAEELRRFVPRGRRRVLRSAHAAPRAGARLPDPEPDNVRASIAGMPEGDRPDLRWYTIRDHDPVTGRRRRHRHPRRLRARLGVDVPAPAGDRVGFRSGGALYRGLEVRGRQVLVADETAVPSLAAILDASAPPTPATRARSPRRGGRPGRARGLRPRRRVTVHVRTGSPGARSSRPSTRRWPPVAHPVVYAWVCGESGLVTGARRPWCATASTAAGSSSAATGSSASPRPSGRHHAWSRVGSTSSTTVNFSAIASRPIPKAAMAASYFAA